MNSELELKPENQDSYEELIIGIESGQGILTPLIAVCDDLRLRELLIRRYEEELAPDLRVYRVRLNQEEPSLRLGVATLIQNEEYLQQKKPAVIMVTGSETLMFVSPKKGERTEVDKFMGYLQWGREGLMRFSYPMVLWVTKNIELQITRSALDFWSWRKGVVHFVQEFLPEIPRENNLFEPQFLDFRDSKEDTGNFLPLEDFKELIAKVEQNNRDDPSLGTMYSRLGRLYTRRLRQGEAEDDKLEKEEAFLSFQKAIELQSKHGLKEDLANTCLSLGNLHYDVAQYREAIKYWRRSLELFREIGDRKGEGISLGNLGNAYQSLGEYQKAIDYHQQSLTIAREIGDRKGEGNTLGNLGNAYQSLGEYQKAIDYHQQSLTIAREIGDRKGEGNTLGNLGNAYQSLGEYQKAIDYHQQFLTIAREIGDRSGEGISLGNLGIAYKALGKYQEATKYYESALPVLHEIGHHRFKANTLFGLGYSLVRLGKKWEAKQAFENARQLYQNMGVKHAVKYCDDELYRLSQMVIAQPTSIPPFGEELPPPVNLEE